MGTADVFQEGDTYTARRQLTTRDVDLDAVIDASQRKIVGITGIRRSGKSSLLMLLRQRLAQRNEKTAYINLEDTRLKKSPQLLDAALK